MCLANDLVVLLSMRRIMVHILVDLEYLPKDLVSFDRLDSEAREFPRGLESCLRA